MADYIPWEDEVLFFKGDDFFDDQLKHIAVAKKSIEIESYIFGDDQTGQIFEKALIAAHQRGVNVRLLVDGFGSIEWINNRSAQFKAVGLNVRIFHPIMLFRQFIHHDFKFNSILNISKDSKSFNRRNHRKVCIVDNETAWIGSMNITDVHSRRASQDKCWRDTGVRIKGDMSAISAGFDYIWKKARDPEVMKIWKPHFIKPGSEITSPLVRTNYTRHLRRKTFAELVERIENSKEKIHITTAYMAPSARFINAICSAAQRGVDVKVILPRVSDVIFMPWVARSFYKDLIECGVQMYEFLPCVLHAKTVTIDNWSKVGSTNLNGRSLRQDYEVDIVLTKENTKKELEERFAQDLSNSEHIKSYTDDFRGQVGRLLLRTFKNWI